MNFFENSSIQFKSNFVIVFEFRFFSISTLNSILLFLNSSFDVNSKRHQFFKFNLNFFSIQEFIVFNSNFMFGRRESDFVLVSTEFQIQVKIILTLKFEHWRLTFSFPFLYLKIVFTFQSQNIFEVKANCRNWRYRNYQETPLWNYSVLLTSKKIESFRFSPSYSCFI